VKTIRWNRPDVIRRVRQDIWRYLTQAARTDDEVLLYAGALLQMRTRDVRTLAQLHFVLSDAVQRLLAQMPFLIRRLATTTVTETEITADRVRGAIRWSETFAARATSGLPHVFVTAPARRAYDTPENQLLAFALTAIAQFGRRTGWHRSTSPTVGDEVRKRVAGATRWLHTRSLSEIDTRPTGPRVVMRVRAGRSRRSYASVLEVVDLHRNYIARLDRQAVREAIEHHALVTRRDPVLLELLCAFIVLQTLEQLGWPPQVGLLRAPLLLSSRKDSKRVDLYYQHAPMDLTAASIYRSVQRGHGFAAVGGLIPDMVLRIAQGSDVRWLLIEVKGVERSVAESARAAASDLLAYRRAFDPVLSAQPGPYGIGVAWGSDLAPDESSEVILCTPDTLPRALESQLA
jgi:hypothetical protein